MPLNNRGHRRSSLVSKTYPGHVTQARSGLQRLILSLEDLKATGSLVAIHDAQCICSFRYAYIYIYIYVYICICIYAYIVTCIYEPAAKPKTTLGDFEQQVIAFGVSLYGSPMLFRHLCIYIYILYMVPPPQHPREFDRIYSTFGLFPPPFSGTTLSTPTLTSKLCLRLHI